MIKQVNVKNFKCLANAKIELGKLTLLTGANSSGKSSLIQAILMLVQTLTSEGRESLNGSLVDVGEFSEARSLSLNKDSINIEIKDGQQSIETNIKYDKNEGKVFAEIKSDEKLDLKNKLNYYNGNIRYLSADRIGSKDLYDKNLTEYEKIGLNGEFAVDYLNKNKSTKLDNELIYFENASRTLAGQLNEWLNFIVNANLSVELVNMTNKLRLSYKYGKNTTSIRPRNIGTGLSYLISVLITCFAGKKGDVVIIENPEIHLHPSAQAKLMEFFAFMSKNGTQLIIETHSDHIFNGLRVAVKTGIIDKEDVTVQYFDIDEEMLVSEITKVNIRGNGSIENYRIGLFDQFDFDLNKLLGL